MNLPWRVVSSFAVTSLGCVQICGVHAPAKSTAGSGMGGAGDSSGAMSASTGGTACVGRPDGTPCTEAGGKACLSGSCVGCIEDNDCGEKASCVAHTCAPGSCKDKAKDGTERDVDCGGSLCPACENGKKCSEDADCVSTLCVDGSCCDAKCDDTCHACAGALTGKNDGQCGAVLMGLQDPTGAAPCAASGIACDGAGACKTQLGVTCDLGTDCLSGFCVDGVCCDTMCSGLCAACSASKKGSGSDGTCDNVVSGSDPDSNCTDQGALSCGTNGSCDGAGACQTYMCPSCAGGVVCGGDSCCLSLAVTGGMFPMGRGSGSDFSPVGNPDEQPEHMVSVSGFHLDAFEVTVGRFRSFLNAWSGTPPAPGAGAHPLIPNSGWQSAWDGNLPGTAAEFAINLKCAGPLGALYTWTDGVGGNEALPINCVSWYEAFAFCAWDGGRFPTEAEWEYAAVGGSYNQLYPWANGAAPNDTLAVFGCGGDNCTFSDIAAAGSKPAGNGRWGHHDLAGSMFEWVLDWYASNWYNGGGASCNDCANLVPLTERVARGGGWVSTSAAGYLRAAARASKPPPYRGYTYGFRCAKDP